MHRKIIIAGGTGTIGRHLIEFFKSQFDEIIVLSRSRSSIQDGYRSVQWDARSQGSWVKELGGAEVVINLTGQSIETRFTEKNKKTLHDSRVDSTRAIGEAIGRSEQMPNLWINASGAAIYPESTEVANDESVTMVGKGFKAKLSQAWEAAATEFNFANTRQVIVRITPVLDNKEGFLPPIKKLTQLCLGGTQGKGDQMISWIHHKDLCSAIGHIIRSKNLDGIVNLTSPEPLSNRAFMKTMRTVVGAPIGLPAPSFAIKLGSIFTGVDPSLIMDSSYVIPSKLLDTGFEFEFPDFEKALLDLI